MPAVSGAGVRDQADLQEESDGMSGKQEAPAAVVSRPSVFDKCYNFTDAAEAREHGIYPYYRPLQELLGSKVVMGGETLIMAGSNNYLGLAQDPRVREAAHQAITRYGTSCSGSRLINGTLVIHE